MGDLKERAHSVSEAILLEQEERLRALEACHVKHKQELLAYPERKTWFVDWLVHMHVEPWAAIAVAHALRFQRDVPQAIGALSGRRLHATEIGRGLIGYMITGARRRWIRRVRDWEISHCAVYKMLWPDVRRIGQWTGQLPTR